MGATWFPKHRPRFAVFESGDMNGERETYQEDNLRAFLGSGVVIWSGHLENHICFASVSSWQLNLKNLNLNLLGVSCCFSIGILGSKAKMELWTRETAIPFSGGVSCLSAGGAPPPPAGRWLFLKLFVREDGSLEFVWRVRKSMGTKNFNLGSTLRYFGVSTAFPLWGIFFWTKKCPNNYTAPFGKQPPSKHTIWGNPRFPAEYAPPGGRARATTAKQVSGLPRGVGGPKKLKKVIKRTKQ